MPLGPEKALVRPVVWGLVRALPPQTVWVDAKTVVLWVLAPAESLLQDSVQARPVI